MNYADKQYFIALRGIAEEEEGENAENAARELRESFEAAQKAAETGEAQAQFDLGIHYDYGFGTEEDDGQAFKYYEKAAMLGNSDGMHYTSWGYGYGRGVEPDTNKFYEWEKKAIFAYYVEGRYLDAVSSILNFADGPPDAEVTALLYKMRNDPRVHECVATRYSFDDVEQRLKMRDEF